MKFKDIKINKEVQFSIGLLGDEEVPAIEVRKAIGFQDHYEYYELSKEEFDLFLRDINSEAVLLFVSDCRSRLKESKLLDATAIVRQNVVKSNRWRRRFAKLFRFNTK